MPVIRRAVLAATVALGGYFGALSGAAIAQNAATDPNGNTPAATDAAAADKLDIGAARQRYHFTRVGDAIVRLDGETGQVTVCTALEVGWGCRAVPEDRVALNAEIARLQGQVDTLHKDVATLTNEVVEARAKAAAANAAAAEAANNVPRPPEPVPPTPDGQLKMPSSADLDHAKEQAKVMIEDAWRRLVDMLDTLRQNMRKDADKDMRKI
jgi:outer membrane murein-binding lipoprotein Lpp